MNQFQILPIGNSRALDFAAQILKQKDFHILDAPQATATHLLLPIPSFTTDGCIHGGQSLESILQKLPLNIKIIGGNLSHPALSHYKVLDLLQDPVYLAKNANITAHCAIRLAMQYLTCTLENCSVLIIGYGRIGKCLAVLLRNLGCDVTVAARNTSDQAILQALGYHAIPPADIDPYNYRLIYNTVPVMLLPQCPGSALKIDLASVQGIESNDTIWAKGLPGKYAPESSGELIANTIIEFLRKEQCQ